MIYKRFVFFHFVVLSTMLQAYAQQTRSADTVNNKTFEKHQGGASLKMNQTSAGGKVKSEVGQGLKNQTSEIKNTSSAIIEEAKVLKKIKPQKNDSINLNVTYEDGKLVLPDEANDIQNLGNQLPNLSNPKLNKDNLPKDLLDKPENHIQKNGTYVKVKNHGDSITQLVEKAQAFKDEIKGGVPDRNHIYSSKTLQKLYDSLGISKMDSLIALAASQDEVSKEELLKQVNSSFSPSSLNDNKLIDQANASKPTDLASMKDKVPTSELSNRSKLNSLPDQTSSTASLKDKIPANLSDMKLSPSDLQQLAPLSGFQLPTDSIPVLASLRKLNLSKEKIRLTENETKDKIKSAVIKQKPTFLVLLC